jgi:amino acid adenylation domain-containing protein
MNRENQVSLCPMTPLQEGLLFNSLSASEPGIDIIQVICTLHEELHVAAFQQAWQQMYARHTILRTALYWDSSGKPTQEIHEQIVFPFSFEDCVLASVQEQQEKLEHYLRDERQRGFVFEQPPLLRLALFKFSEAEYSFVLTFHHAILDGRSLPILFKDAFDTYEAIRSDATLKLPAAQPYWNYAIWLQAQDLTPDETFWKRTLDGFSLPTTLPLEQSSQDLKPDTASHPEQSLLLSSELSQALRQYANKHQLTLNTLFQGAWAFVLSRYSGQTDVVFGAVRSCRRGTLPEAESMVGLFLNTLPIRVHIKSEAMLLPWLRELRAQGIALRDHQFTALSQVQQWSQIPRGLSLFESIFVFENRSIQSTLQSYGGPWSKRDFSLRRKPDAPLALYIFAEPEILVTGIYDQQRLLQATIIRLLHHFQDVLTAIANDMEMRLDELPSVGEEERELLLSTWNATQQDYPRDMCIHQLVEAQAARIPDALAIQVAEQRLTYGQVNERANQIAHLLRSLGVGPDTCVGVCMQRSPEAIISQLGILKAGGAFLMLDPEYPQERLHFLLEDAQVRVVLTQQKHRMQLPVREKIAVIALDVPVDPLLGWSAQNLSTSATSTNLAYIIYTSGSTGRPKGVQIQHNGLVNVATWYGSTFKIQEQDRATHLATLTFDASVLEIWPCLAAGASLHLVDEETRVHPHSLMRCLIEHSITIAFLPTPLGEAILQEDWPDRTPLRVLTMGGDRLMRGPGAAIPFEVYNLYGPTESSIVATWTLVPPASENKLPPIGRPIANTRIYLLDQQLALVPIGAIGELYIGGDGLARGYLNRPELTAACFLQDPFDQQDGSRLYRSGDLARYQQDGSLEYIGRTDNQVKIRGLRIELLEIETTLAQHPAVKTAVVLARENDRQEKQLLAYILPEQQPSLDKSDLHHFLHQKLPAYMIPATIVVLEKLPLMPSGKVDRRALATAEVNWTEQETQYEAPRTATEIALAAIWEQVLKDRPNKDQPIGINDNFFELGGHSLLAGKIILQVKNVMHIKLSLRVLLNAPTISLLATYIEHL